MILRLEVGLHDLDVLPRHRLLRKAGGSLCLLWSGIAESGSDLAPADGDHRSPAIVGLESGESSACVSPLNRDYGHFVHLDDLLQTEQPDFRADVWGMDLVPPPVKPVVAVIRTVGQRFGPVSEFDVRTTQVRRRVSCIKSVEPATHHVNDLLRHRLFPEPGGFEGSGSVPKAPDEQRNPAVAHGPHAKQPHAGLYPAAAPLPRYAVAHKDVVIRVDELLGRDSKVLPHLVDLFEKASEPVDAAMDTGVENVSRQIDHSVWMDEFRDCREVAVGPELVDAPHDLDVRLRHRLLPQPCGFESCVDDVRP